MDSTEKKTTTITVRIAPRVKEGLKVMAASERRSQANMVEVMIRDYCERHGTRIKD